MSGNLQRREVHFAGRVQGVGFRFTTVRIARNYQVTGFVRNVADGRVQLVAEGTAQELNAFLAEVEQTMSGYIRDVRWTTAAATGEFAEFSVAH